MASKRNRRAQTSRPAAKAKSDPAPENQEGTQAEGTGSAGTAGQPAEGTRVATVAASAEGGTPQPVQGDDGARAVGQMAATGAAADVAAVAAAPEANDADGSADGGAGEAVIEPEPEDFNLNCAAQVMGAVLEGAADVVLLLDRDAWEKMDPHALEHGDAIAELGRFTRLIGDRATPAVLAQQLLIKKLRPTAELSRPEEIALKVFTSTLIELDGFAAAERRRIEDANRVPVEIPLLPAEETTLEGVGGALDTY